MVILFIVLINLVNGSSCTKKGIEGCTKCELTETMEKCIACTSEKLEGFYYTLNENKCTKCPEGCTKCDKDGKCLEDKCLTGRYFKSDDGSCPTCPNTGDYATCSACTSATVCTQCAQGKHTDGFYYTLNSGKCTKCTEHCTQCDKDGKCKKGKCLSGYGLDTTENKNTCVKCDEHCTTCTTNGEGKCDKPVEGTSYCFENYYYNKFTQTCSYAANAVDSFCAKSNATEGVTEDYEYTCMDCEGGYEFEDGGKKCKASAPAPQDDSSVMVSIVLGLIALIALF